jgi:hypothetical protein
MFRARTVGVQGESFRSDHEAERSSYGRRPGGTDSTLSRLRTPVESTALIGRRSFAARRHGTQRGRGPLVVSRQGRWTHRRLPPARSVSL